VLLTLEVNMQQQADEMVLNYPEPAGLAADGRALWSSIASKYVMRPDELRHLEDACRLVDIMAALRSAADGEPMMIPGSTGQMVLNPLVAEQKTHALAVGTLLARCKLPDLDPSSGAGAEPNQHRAAAQSKWSAAHGKGA
jgi:hypothetical protein